MRIFLHVGYPKTGTTALQETLYNGRDTLAAAGVLYPDVGVFRARHAHLSWSCMTLGKWAAGRYNGRSAADMITEIAAMADGHETTIISSEDFSYQQPSRYAPVIDALAEMGSVSVVVYVRAQVEAFESMYKQIVRNRGYAKPFRDFVDETLTDAVGDAPYGEDGMGWGGSLPPYDYGRFANSWVQAVPGGRVIVAPYGQDAKRDIVGSFFATIGVQMPPGLEVVSRANVSIEGDLLELLRRANKYVPPKVRHKLANDIAWANGQLGLHPMQLATTEERRRIEGHFTDSNRSLAERHRGGVPLFGPTDG